jgi:hypothetical protein
VCALLAGAAAYAQEYRGAFSGSVTDPHGAAIVKATVVARETRTGTRSSAVSDAAGQYLIPFLSPGEYELSAESPGFKKFVHTGITLQANDHPVIDIRMEVGAVSDSITITASAPILETQNPTLGQAINTAEVDALPVNGRTPMMLDNLAFGVVSTFEPGPVRPFDNSAPNSISIGGAPSSRNEVLLDGSPNAGQTNQMAYSPPQDAVTEVRVNVFDMDAGFGHTMGGTVNVITRSGTNDLHGSAYIYNQTSEVDANTFFNNRNSVPRPKYHQNQYGLTAGGPVWIPKIFNGKNRLFWFFGWEGMHDSDPADSPLETGSPEDYTTVPTQAERQGDFSALLGVPGNNYTIYDPNSGVVSGTTVSRTAFPNNVIPTNRLNPISLNYLKYYPLPNFNRNANGQLNYLIDAIDSDRYNNFLGRTDVNISDRNKLSFSARYNQRQQNKNNFFLNPATGNYLYRINQGAGLDDVYTISPTLFTNVRVNWTRYIENHASPADGIDPSTLGFPSYIDANAEFKMLPYLTFAASTGTSAGATGVSGGGRANLEPLGYNGDGNNFSDIFTIFADAEKIHGNHDIKVGVDAREYRWSAFNFGNPSGTYGFNAAWTNNPAVSNSAAPIGQEMASFLLGLPSAGSLDINTQSTVQAKYAALFLNDNWRARHDLTLSLGIRWERDFAQTERFNRSVNGFDPTAVNSASTAAAAAYAASPSAFLPASQFKALGGLTFASANAPAIYTPSSRGIFSPRMGFAWTPAKLESKTVFRGGVGVLVDPILLITPNQPGFSQQTTLTATNNNFLSPADTFSTPFAGGVFLQPSGSSKGVNTNLGSASVTFVNPHPRNPYTVRWELSVQHQLPGNMVLEVAYVGNHAMHLSINTQLDYIPRQYLSTSLARDSNVINNLTGATANPFLNLVPGSLGTSKTVAVSQLLVPFPQYTFPGPPQSTSNGVVMQSNPAGTSYYQSLNVRLQKRVTRGLFLMNNFIWNSMIDRLAYLNDSDQAPEKRPSSDSRPLREVLTATYDLPIGRGRALNLNSRVLDGIVGGWGASVIFVMQSGPTLSWGNYIYYGGPLNYQSNQPDGTSFATSQFNTISAQQLADNIRTFDNQFNTLRRNRTNQVDTSLTKNFKFAEKRYVQIRLEAFNTFNHVTFGNATTSPTSSAFATITTQANTPRRIETAIKLVW